MSDPQIGPFTLLHPLGGGGMAEVWKARFQARQLDVALKLLVHLEQLGEDAQANVKNEVRVIAGLNHPNIITLYDLGELETTLKLETTFGEALVVPARTPYLVMELVSGGTLEQLAPQLTWPTLKSILLVLLDALAHAHARGILHLDMKPENVLLDETRDPGRLKLSDFGIAQALDRRDLTDATGKRRELDKHLQHLVGQVMGTPVYMAPEQFLGDWRSQGPWTDLYSLGCMTYKLVAGAPPFESETLMAIGAAHCNEPPPPLRPLFPVPDGLVEWILRLLEKRPEARFQRAADAAWALEQLPEPDPSRFTPVEGGRNLLDRSAVTLAAGLTGVGMSPLVGLQTPLAPQSGVAQTAAAQTKAAQTPADQTTDKTPGRHSSSRPAPTPPPGAALPPRGSGGVSETPTLRMTPLFPPQPSQIPPTPTAPVHTLSPLPPDTVAMFPSLPGYHGPSVFSLLHPAQAASPGAASAAGMAQGTAQGSAASKAPGTAPSKAQLPHSLSTDDFTGITLLDTELPEYARSEATLWEASLDASGQHSLPAPAMSIPATQNQGPPPLPLSWMSASDQMPFSPIQGLGLSLYGLRAIPLVDREEERDAIWSLLHQVHTRGRARLVVLQGTTGIGKSRLAEWVAERAHEVGAASIFIAEHSPGQLASDGLPGMLARFLRCVGLSPSGALVRITQVLGALGIADPRLEQALLAWMLPLLASTEADPVASVPLAERHAALRQLMELLSLERPLIVVLDDVQWGGEAIRFCRGLLQVQSLRPSRILLLLTALEEGLTERLLEASELEELLKQEGAQRLKLGPLPTPDHAQLVRELLGLEPSVAQQVEERTAGNPLFAIQLVGDWVARGLLIPGTRGFCLRPGTVLPLPDDIHQMWDERIRQLLHGMSQQAHPALELAAVLGQTVNLHEWRAAIALAGLTFTETQQNHLLDALLTARLIRPPQGESSGMLNIFTFSHGMLRESLLRASRDSGRDQKLHLACARMLEQRYKPNALGIPERLGRHFLEANALEPSLGPLLKAADIQRDQSHYDRALELLDRRDAALDALKIPPVDPRRGEGELLRAQLGIDLRRPDRSVRALTRLQQGMQQTGWQRLYPAILRVHGDYFRYVGDFKTARSWYDQALPLAEYLGLRLEQALVLRGLANVAWEENDVHTTVRLYQQALALFQEQGDLVRVAAAHTFLGHVAQQVGENDTARGWFLAAKRLGETHGLQSVLADALRGLGRIKLYYERDPNGAMTLFQQAAEILERLGGHYSLVDCKNELGEAARAAGKYDLAARHFQESIELAVRTGSSSRTCATMNLATVRLLQQRPQEAIQLLEGQVEELIKAGRPRFVGGIYAIRAWAAAVLGRWGQASQWVGEAAVWLGKSSAVDEEDVKALERTGTLAGAVGQVEVSRQALTEVVRLWQLLNKPDQVARVQGLMKGR